MKMKSNILFLFTFGIFATSAFAAEKGEALAPAIKEVSVEPSKPAFGGWSEPVEIRSAEEAEKHFEGDALAKLNKEVDFEKQIVLVFSWRGSGQDMLEYAVLESFPEQVVFSYKPGRTRDLRPHVHVYALRSNVRWRVPGKR